jgi:hypothetical protein
MCGKKEKIQDPSARGNKRDTNSPMRSWGGVGENFKMKRS